MQKIFLATPDEDKEKGRFYKFKKRIGKFRDDLKKDIPAKL